MVMVESNDLCLYNLVAHFAGRRPDGRAGRERAGDGGRGRLRRGVRTAQRLPGTPKHMMSASLGPSLL